MKILFKNIKSLLQVRPNSVRFVSGVHMNKLPTIDNAYLVVENGLIADYGPMHNCPNSSFSKIVDAGGKMILPSWCDSHTHIVYAGSREKEFVDRINGLSYQEIAKNGGGILNSAKILQQTSEQDLYNQSKNRLDEVIKYGTGAIEIKSGYGLTLDAEIKMLKVIQRLKNDYDIPIKATFLGAHAIPNQYQYRKSEFVKLLIDEFIPKIVSEDLADFIDVFCEKGYFSIEDTSKILEAGKQYGLQGKIHVNQFNAFGGVAIGVKNNALSVDHLEVINDEDIKILKTSKTMPVSLPSCSYFLGIPYTASRQIIDAGLPLALASDYNPGSSPSGNMNFVVATACIKMNMTPEEAINAATINGAYAMGLEDKVGSITKGKLANFILTKPINSYACIPYSFGTSQIESVFLNAKRITKGG